MVAGAKILTGDTIRHVMMSMVMMGGVGAIAIAGGCEGRTCLLVGEAFFAVLLSLSYMLDHVEQRRKQ